MSAFGIKHICASHYRPYYLIYCIGSKRETVREFCPTLHPRWYTVLLVSHPPHPSPHFPLPLLIIYRGVPLPGQVYRYLPARTALLGTARCGTIHAAAIRIGEGDIIRPVKIVPAHASLVH